MTKKNRMYDEFAHLWTIISKPEDYAEEANYWKDAITKRLGDKRHKILEIGVGGGNNLSHLSPFYETTAVDLSEKMMENSKKINPNTRHLVGDMRDFRLDEKFDAVFIHDAISYMTTLTDLKKAFITAWEHLRPGGVFISSPDFHKETFKETRPILSSTKSNGNFELTYCEYFNDPDPNDTTFECHYAYFIKDLKTKKVDVEIDHHTCGLFYEKEWITTLESVGFKFELDDYPVHENGYESWLFVGIKPE